MFEVICYKNGRTTNNSPYFNSLFAAEEWVLYNVKHNETALLRVYQVGDWQVAKVFQGMDVIGEN